MDIYSPYGCSIFTYEYRKIYRRVYIFIKTFITTEYSPTIQYFIEKSKNNAQLSEFESRVLIYIETCKSFGDPADQYFKQLRSIKMAAENQNFALSYIEERLLTYYEQEAMSYVNNLTASIPANSI